MKIPFTYGKIVAENDFTDRIEETRKLVGNILSQTNTAIISPRRWGKSSLVNRAIETVSRTEKGIQFVRMNAFKCESMQDFYELFAKRVIEDVSTSTDTLLSNAKDFISHLIPKLSIMDPAGHYELSFGIDLQKTPIGEEILDLPQQIAARRKKKIVVCIDEFQQIGEFRDTSKCQKILRNHWQEQKDVAYILYGSKKHMMLNIFGEYNSPFYKFGDLMFLPKISNADWTEYIVSRFNATGKHIQAEVASHLAELVENHSYYVQQLAQYAWLRTESICTGQTVNESFQALLDSVNLQFVNLMDSLTEKQRSFLYAISQGTTNLSSVQTLSLYRLGTSANIKILKDALKKRDMIDITGKKVEIQDPLLKQWLLQVYSKTF